MHPDRSFDPQDRDACVALVEDVGFAMIFAAMPDGPRVAHAPVVWSGDGALRFHLSARNALVPHLDGATVLCVVNGPDAYVSARWYSDPAQVPTWNYVSVEMEGAVRRLDDDGLRAQLEAVTTAHEARIVEGEAWTIDKMPEDKLRAMMKGIVGFELAVTAWRPTFKLSQNKRAEERERVMQGLEAAGGAAMVATMRKLAA